MRNENSEAARVREEHGPKIKIMRQRASAKSTAREEGGGSAAREGGRDGHMCPRRRQHVSAEIWSDRSMCPRKFGVSAACVRPIAMEKFK